jgi:sodium transport system permease protein
MVEMLRDRRTWLTAVLLPALTMPLVVLLMPALLQRQQMAVRDRPARVAVVGQAAASLAAAGARMGTLRIASGADPMSALLRGDLDAILDSTGPGSPPEVVVVLYDASRPASAAAAAKIAAVASRPHDVRGPAGGSGRDPRAHAWAPVVEARNVASAERMGGALLAAAMPLFLVVWAALGGQHAALDVGVGERERGSLEVLLASPADPSALVAGKFLAVLAPAVLTLVVALASAFGALSLGGSRVLAGTIRLAMPAGVALALLAVGVALAALLSAVQLAASLAARTLRQAQQALAGLYLLAALPTVLASSSGVLDRSWISLVPVVNAAAVTRRLLASGEVTWDVWVTVLVLVAATTPVAILAFTALEQRGGSNC